MQSLDLDDIAPGDSGLDESRIAPKAQENADDDLDTDVNSWSRPETKAPFTIVRTGQPSPIPED